MNASSYSEARHTYACALRAYRQCPTSATSAALDEAEAALSRAR